MKTVITLAAAGVFALSTSAWAGEGHNCGSYQQSVQTEKPTITLATMKATTKQTAGTHTASTQTSSTQTSSTGDKTTKPGS
jgi:hypothetical protein